MTKKGHKKAKKATKNSILRYFDENRDIGQN